MARASVWDFDLQALRRGQRRPGCGAVGLPQNVERGAFGADVLQFNHGIVRQAFLHRLLKDADSRWRLFRAQRRDN